MGLDARELRRMELPRLLCMLGELADMNAPGDGARDADQDDIWDFLM